MKYATIALALASTSFAQDCRRKEGQLSYLRDLIAQWTLYKKQVAANAVISAEQTRQEGIRATREGEITALSAERLSNFTSAVNARISEIEEETTSAVGAIASDLAVTLGNIETRRTTKLASLANKLNDAQSANSAKVTKMTNKITNIGNNLVRAQNKINAKHASSLSRAANNYANAISSAESTRDTKVSKQNSILSNKVGQAATSYAQRVATAEGNAESEINRLTGTLRDVNATLALIEDAGNGGLDFPSDCLFDPADVIALVKSGLKPTAIWGSLI